MNGRSYLDWLPTNAEDQLDALLVREKADWRRKENGLLSIMFSKFA